MINLQCRCDIYQNVTPTLKIYQNVTPKRKKEKRRAGKKRERDDSWLVKKLYDGFGNSEWIR